MHYQYDIREWRKPLLTLRKYSTTWILSASWNSVNQTKHGNIQTVAEYRIPWTEWRPLFLSILRSVIYSLLIPTYLILLVVKNLQEKLRMILHFRLWWNNSDKRLVKTFSEIILTKNLLKLSLKQFWQKKMLKLSLKLAYGCTM